MNHSGSTQHENYPDSHHDNYSRTIFGFWLYLMSDFILFGTLFATYAVLSYQAFGGTTAKDIFNIHYTLTQTLVFLFASLTAGLGGAYAHRKERELTLAFFGITFVLGIVFMAMMMKEFSYLVASGNGWDKSAFLSGYFTVVGTHGVHVLFGLLWILVLLVPVWKEGVSKVSIRRLTCLRMFWQFLNIIWVLIFSFVYLMGVK
jgi:cytochrome o ubiquinol oxidase subunit III